MTPYLSGSFSLKEFQVSLALKTDLKEVYVYLNRLKGSLRLIVLAFCYCKNKLTSAFYAVETRFFNILNSTR